MRRGGFLSSGAYGEVHCLTCVWRVHARCLGRYIREHQSTFATFLEEYRVQRSWALRSAHVTTATASAEAAPPPNEAQAAAPPAQFSQGFAAAVGATKQPHADAARAGWDSVHSLLVEFRLVMLEDVIMDTLGVMEVADVLDLTKEDLHEAGFKPVQVGFWRVLFSLVASKRREN